jgi:hypothetical protein
MNLDRDVLKPVREPVKQRADVLGSVPGHPIASVFAV